MTNKPLTLWGRATSANVQKVLWALAELDIPFERIDAGGKHGYPDDYKQINPNHRVPTMVDGGFTLYESNAIVRYLTRKHAGVLTPLGGHDGWAVADQWMDWTAVHFTQPFTAVFWQKVRTRRADLNPALLDAQVKLMFAAAQILDQRLAQAKWLAGDAFSMADVPAGAVMYRYFDIDVQRPELPHLRRWFEALKTREPYQQVVLTSYEDLRVTD